MPTQPLSAPPLRSEPKRQRKGRSSLQAVLGVRGTESAVACYRIHAYPKMTVTHCTDTARTYMYIYVYDIGTVHMRRPVCVKTKVCCPVSLKKKCRQEDLSGNLLHFLSPPFTSFSSSRSPSGRQAGKTPPSSERLMEAISRWTRCQASLLSS